MTLVEELRETWRILQREPLLEVAADRIHDLEAERAELLDRIEELEKTLWEIRRDIEECADDVVWMRGGIETVVDRINAVIGATSKLHSDTAPTQPSVTPELDKETK